nr:MAG: nonstructural protein 1 [Parvoviridae sp.]UCS96306.1 MAG: nonstructural protein 1 [Parvoviridae sp.]
MSNNERTMDSLFPTSVAVDDSRREGEQSAQLEDINTTCAHYLGGSEFDEPLRLRYIQRRLPEAYRELDSLREEVVGRYIREVNGEGWRSSKQYHSEVYIYRSKEQRVRMLSRLSECARGYPGRFLLWTDEGDHLHVVHDCSFSNGQCRCFFSKSEDFRRELRSPMRRKRFLSEMDTIDWTNVFIYFLLSKWESQSQIWIGGKYQGLPTRNEIVRWRDMQTKSREILAREEERDRYNTQLQERPGEDSREFIPTSVQEIGKKRSLAQDGGGVRKKTKFQRISETVQTLLGELFILPANHLKDVLVHTDHCNTLFDPANDKVYDSACAVFTRRFNILKFKDLYNMYNGKECIFYANDLNPFHYYHDLDTSTKYINDLLKYQYGDDQDQIRELLINIREWFNLQGWDGNKKMNCVCIVGPPNSGKNYFWDMLAALAYNVGHIGRVNNKTNQFALQECYGRRLIMGNEISMEEGAKEDFKKLCEGTAFNIRVKYQGDKIFTRAPVCLISNSMLDICYDRHFKDIRLKTIKWNTCPLLKDSNKKPYPLCLYNLFDMYNVQYE